MALPNGINVQMSLAESLIALGHGYRLPFRIDSRPVGTDQQTIADGASAYILIRHSTHAIMLIGRELTCDRTDVLYTVHRDPVVNQIGSPIPIISLNGEMPNPSANQANVIAPVDVVDEGPEVDYGIPAAGGNPNAASSPYSTAEFKVLPHDSDFLLRIHNRSGNVVSMFSLVLRWCELYPAAWKG